MEGFRTIFRHFGTCRIFYGHQNVENPQMKIPKNAIFQNYLKFELKGLGYRFRVQNVSKTSHVSISGHISCVRSIPADLSKIEFLPKITILTILRHFQWNQYASIIWPEVAGIVICGQKCVLLTPKILVHTSDDILWCLETF